MLKNWLKVYWYNVLRNKFYFLLTVLGLAIGLSAVIISYLYYSEEKSYDTWHPYSDNVFAVESKFSETESWPMLSYPYGSRIKTLSPEVDSYAYVDNHYREGILFINGEQKIFKSAIFSQSSFFELFPFEIINGDKKKPFDGPNQVFIKDTYVAYLFGAANPVGKTITAWGTLYTVKGVFKSVETKNSIDPNLVFNTLDQREKEAIAENGWGNFNCALWLKLNDATKKEAVEKRLIDIYNNEVIAPEAKKRGMANEEFKKQEGYVSFVFVLNDLKNQRLIGEVYKNATPEGAANGNKIYIVIGLSVLILLLSVFNYINLTTVQMMNRGREVGVRKTFGASQKSLIYQNYFESFITCTLSIFLAFVIVEFSLPSLRVFFKASLVFNVFLYIPQILLFLAIVVVLVGTIPALYISSFRTVEVLKGNIKRNKKGIWFKNLLLTVQFVVACFFIIGSIIVNQQVNYMMNKDLGYKPDQIVAVQYNFKPNTQNPVEIYDRLKADILKIDGVEAVTTWTLALGGKVYASAGYSYNGNMVQAGVASMDDNALDVFDIKMKEGRKLSNKLATDSIDNVLINEKAALLMQEPNPVGKRFEWNGERLTIVGVVKDFNLFGLDQEYRPLLFMTLNKDRSWAGNIQEMSIKISAEKSQEVLDAIEKIWKKHNISEAPFTYEFVDKRFATTYNKTIQERNVFMVLNGLVVFIALFGLYSLASFTINSRLKEVAIRKVLGASAKSLIKQLTTQYILFCLLGFGIAVFPSYYFLNKWLSDYAFRIEIGIIPFIVCFIIIAILTLLIVLIKAYKATRINVLKYIKYE
ncbi:MAG: ABC transporter permease [Flavobacteriaceae bacterium]|jgi:putative ABC transport system permease protein|nr:ABC transporter permease [Flavobacteriaceae bacterium]